MKLYTVQYRESGEDYQVNIFKTEQEALSFAETFLSQFVSSYIDFENLEYQCHDRDLAYIEIDYHTI